VTSLDQLTKAQRAGRLANAHHPGQAAPAVTWSWIWRLGARLLL